jgi:hypothetical protein
MLGISAMARGAVLADYPNFSDVSKLQLNGDASQAGDVLQLTSTASDQTGTAFTKKRVLNQKKSWKTDFSFSMHDSTGLPGDGMAFFIHSTDKGAIGDGGGGLGFGSIGDSLAIEFDTFDNGGSDEQANEVSIIVNGKAGKTKDSGVPSGFDLYGGLRDAWVTYKAKSHKVKVWVTDTGTKPSTPIVTAKVDLEKVLGEKSFAGFTAATGGANEEHDVLDWTLTQ